MNGFDVADQNLISVGRSVERLVSNLRFPELGQAIKMHSIARIYIFRFPPVLLYHGRTRAPTDMVGVSTDQA